MDWNWMMNKPVMIPLKEKKKRSIKQISFDRFTMMRIKMIHIRHWIHRIIGFIHG